MLRRDAAENNQGASARDRIVSGVEAVNKQKELHLQELRETAKRNSATLIRRAA